MPRTDHTPRAGGLGHHWPMLLLVVVVLYAYVDLKTDMVEVQARLGASPAMGPAASPPVQPAPGGDAPGQPATGQGQLDLNVGAGAVSWECAGTVSEEDLRPAVGRHGADVFTCHQTQAAEASGLLSLDLNVNEEGRIVGARASGTMLGRDPFIQCVRAALQRWQFPKAVGGSCAIVTLPFMLGQQPNGPAASP